MKKVILIIFMILMVILCLPLALYIPFLQDSTTKWLKNKLHHSAGVELSVEKLRLSFPLNLKAYHVLIIDPKVQPNDTLLRLDELTLYTDLSKLLKGKINIREFKGETVQLNSKELLSGLMLKGKLNHIQFETRNIDLKEEIARIGKISINGLDLLLQLSDTSKKEEKTPSNPLLWNIIANNIDFNDIKVTIDIPLDSFKLISSVNHLSADSIKFGFHNTTYALANALLDKGAILIMKKQDSLLYNHFSVKTSLKGSPSRYEAGYINFQTPYSEINIQGMMALDSVRNSLPDSTYLRINGKIGAQDLFRYAQVVLPESYNIEAIEPIDMNIRLIGNQQCLVLDSTWFNIKDRIKLEANVVATHFADSSLRTLQASVNGEIGKLNELLRSINPVLTESFLLPRGVTLSANASLDAKEMKAEANITEKKGKIVAKAIYNQQSQKYEASVIADQFSLTSIRPQDSIHSLSAQINLKGNGIDFSNRATSLEFDGMLSNLQLRSRNLGGIKIAANYAHNHATAFIESNFVPATGSMMINADYLKNNLTGVLQLVIHNLDLRFWGITDSLVQFASKTNLKINSNMMANHNMILDITDAIFIHDATKKELLRPLHATFVTQTDTTILQVNAGDLEITSYADRGIDRVGKQLSNLIQEFNREWKNSHINPTTLKNFLPEMNINISAGKLNPISRLLSANRVDYEHFDSHLTLSSDKGIHGIISTQLLKVDTVLIDTVRFIFSQDSSFHTKLYSNRTTGIEKLKFNLNANLDISEEKADLYMLHRNGKGMKGIDLGITLTRSDSTIQFRFFPEQPIIGYTKYNLIPDNYIHMRHKDKRFFANLSLEAEDGSHISLYSLPNEEAQQALSIQLEKIALAPISQLFPTYPAMNGLFGAKTEWIMNNDMDQFNTAVKVDTLSINHRPIGNIAFDASYYPNENQTQEFKGKLRLDEKELAQTSISYTRLAIGIDSISGIIDVNHLPLFWGNLFLSPDLLRLTGASTGKIEVSGSSKQPIFNGTVALDTASFFLPDYNVKLFPDKSQLTIKENQVLFNNYSVFAAGKTPFILNGNIDIMKAWVDLSLRGDNYELLNAKESSRAIIYGKAFVNANTTIKGPFESLVVRGNLRILSSTDLTYVMKDSPLTVRDRMSELVTFVSFSDTTTKEVVEPLKYSGIDVSLNITVDQAAQLRVDLDENRESTVALIGGGNLSMTYNQQGEFLMRGRYTMSGGTVKYTMPLIPLKTFNVKEGSYLEWNGDVANPHIDITAIEKIKSSITSDNSTARTVNFDVSIGVKNQLSNLNLIFDIDAPEDITIHNELIGMTQEERSRQALNMLITNSYSSNGSAGVGKISMNNALSNFLQSEINNIAGSTFKDTEINFGIDTYGDNMFSNQRTDYSFSFRKRLFNNRISVLIGGKVSTGSADETTNNQSFIDNISLEYRLDNSGTRYIQLFYDKNYESLLEGEITEMGGGIILRKRMNHLRELFKFRPKKTIQYNTK